MVQLSPFKGPPRMRSISCQGVLNRRSVLRRCQPDKYSGESRVSCYKADRLVASLPSFRSVQSSHAVRKFHAEGKRTLRTRLWRMGVCEPLMPDVVASKAQSQLRELSVPTFGFTTQGFSMVGGYTGNLEKPQNCQNWRVGAWSSMGTCSGQYGRCKSTITCILKPHPSWRCMILNFLSLCEVAR